MRLLLIGGSVFLGRALTDAALAAGHAVTHVNRGRSGRDARVETIVVDRATGDLDAALGATTWDAVVDTCGYLPQVVGRSVAALLSRAGRYAFVSSISVYRAFEAEGFDESAEVQPTPDPLPEAMTPETYGALKSACERVVESAFGERAFVVRPGLIVGPHDPSDRFTWWPWRAAQGGRFVAPGRPGRRIQLIDVRDLAGWMIASLASGAAGTVQATGPASPLTMGELVEACVGVAGGSSEPVWLPDDFLLANGAGPWKELPLWLPENDASHRGFMAADCSKARSLGLACRPLEDTVRDTLDWARTRPAGHDWKAGLGREREAGLLASGCRPA